MFEVFSGPPSGLISIILEATDRPNINIKDLGSNLAKCPGGIF